MMLGRRLLEDEDVGRKFGLHALPAVHRTYVLVIQTVPLPCPGLCLGAKRTKGRMQLPAYEARAFKVLWDDANMPRLSEGLRMMSQRHGSAL